MNKSDSIAELSKALAAAQAAMRPASMNSVNPYFKSKYASLPEIWDSIRDVLTKHGLSVIQTAYDGPDGAVGVNTILLHSSGEWIESPGVTVKPTKAGPQEVGIIITYLRRYSLAAMIGQVADQDDDGEGAMDRKNKLAPQATPQAAQQTSTTADEGVPWQATDKQKKAIKAIGAKIWTIPDENGEHKPDWHRIQKEVEKIKEKNKWSGDLTQIQANVVIKEFEQISDSIPF